MNTDLIAIIGNISRSFSSVQLLVTALAYLLGLLFFITAIQKFRKIGDQKAHSSSQEKMFVPTAYLLGGTALLFLPSMSATLANTVFGVGNVLQYETYSPINIVNSMSFIVRTCGVIWFVRGSVLLAHASEPGVQHGPKGMMFLIAGIFAMNFETTFSYLNWAISEMISHTLHSPGSADA